MYHIVYLTTNLVNNKIYIGVHSTYDIDDGYLGSGETLKLAIRKYGKHNFKRDILYYCHEISHAYELESQIVDVQFINKRNVYNMCIGGFGGIGYKRLPSKFKGISYIDRYGVEKAEQLIQNSRKLNMGRKLSAQTKQLLSLKHKGQVAWNKGLKGTTVHTEESKQKLRDARANQKFTNEMYDKIRNNKNISKYDYIIISPTGTEYIVTDGLLKFCNEHSLKYSFMISNIGKGTISKYVHKSLLGKNCIGWNITKI